MVDDDGAEAVAGVWEEWQDAVNMSAGELETWLDTDESQAVGDSGGDGESTGHRSGRRIIEILQTDKTDLTADDAAHMRKVVGYVHRHTAQGPSGGKEAVQDSKWRYSLMNWGHDPLKE